MPEERALIQRLAAQLGAEDRLLHDTYVDPERRLILTTDLLVEHQHFTAGFSAPADIGWKSMAVNLSDIAATGGEPRFALVSIALPSDLPNHWVTDCLAGMQDLLARTGGLIVGGDTVGGPVVIINVALVGELPLGATPGRRDQARPGDRVITTGWGGLSAVGLQALQQQQTVDVPESVAVHRRPTPRLALGQALARAGHRFAMMDTSDGLADAALKLAEASGVSLRLSAEALPVHDEVRHWACHTGQPPLDLVLYGGEDFELLATIPPDAAVPEGWTVIGDVVAGTPGAVLINRFDEVLEALTFSKTFDHFAAWDALTRG